MPFTVDHQRDVAFSIMAFWAGMKDPSQAKKEAEDLALEVANEIKEKGTQVAQGLRDKINQLVHNFKSWLLGSVNDFIAMMKRKLTDLLPTIPTWPELFQFEFDFNLERFIPDFSSISGVIGEALNALDTAKAAAQGVKTFYEQTILAYQLNNLNAEGPHSITVKAARNAAALSAAAPIAEAATWFGKKVAQVNLPGIADVAIAIGKFLVALCGVALRFMQEHIFKKFRDYCGVAVGVARDTSGMLNLTLFQDRYRVAASMVPNLAYVSLASGFCGNKQMFFAALGEAGGDDSTFAQQILTMDKAKAQVFKDLGASKYKHFWTHEEDWVNEMIEGQIKAQQVVADYNAHLLRISRLSRFRLFRANRSYLEAMAEANVAMQTNPSRGGGVITAANIAMNAHLQRGGTIPPLERASSGTVPPLERAPSGTVPPLERAPSGS